MITLKLRRSLGKEQEEQEELLVREVREVGGCRVQVCVRELSVGGLQEAPFSEPARKELLGGTPGLLFVHL